MKTPNSLIITTFLILGFAVFQANGSYESCTRYFESLPGSPSFPSVILSSGKNINDLGSFDTCKRQPGNRFFLLSSINPIGSLNFALCLSNQCDVADIYALLYQYGLSTINGSPVAVIETEEQKAQLDGGGITVIVIIALIGLVSLIAPASRLLKYLSGSKEPKSKPSAPRPEDPLLEKAEGKEGVSKSVKKPRITLLSVVECFSIDKNFEKYLNLPAKTPLTFFNGIRSLSLFWVIYGHEFLNRLFLLSNYTSYPKILSSASFLMYTGGFFAVDVFFWMSGFLFSYLILEAKSAKIFKKPFAYVAALIHRYFRIIPAYLIGLLIYFKLLSLMGDGPVYPLVSYSTEQCDSMWRNILFIQNFFTDKSCFGWGWYLAVDFQLFVVSFFFIVVYLLNKTIGKLFAILSMIALCFVALGLCIQNEWYAFPFSPKTGTYFQDFYVKPWTRAAPYLCGFILGIYYREYVNEKPMNITPDMKEYDVSFNELNPEKKGVLSKLEPAIRNNFYYRLCLYAAGLFLINMFIFIPRQYQLDNDSWTPATHYFFNAFSKVFFVIGLTFLFLPTLLGHKDVFGWIMSLDIFGYIARISYVAYIIHYMIIVRSVYNTRVGYYYTDEMIIYYTLADILITLGLSLPFSLLFEVPFMNLEKLLKGK